MDTIQDTVAQAINDLDQIAPEGWRERIDLGLLDLGSLRSCVLSQVFTDPEPYLFGYGEGTRLLDELHDSEELPYDWDVFANNRMYLDEWRRQLGGS